MTTDTIVILRPNKSDEAQQPNSTPPPPSLALEGSHVASQLLSPEAAPTVAVETGAAVAKLLDDAAHVAKMLDASSGGLVITKTSESPPALPETSSAPPRPTLTAVTTPATTTPRRAKTAAAKATKRAKAAKAKAAAEATPAVRKVKAKAKTTAKVVKVAKAAKAFKAAKAAKAAKLKPTTGQSGPRIKSLGWEDMNKKEKLLLGCFDLKGEREVRSIEQLGKEAFRSQSTVKAYSWARNSLRRLIRARLLEKVAPGSYRLAAETRAILPG